MTRILVLYASSHGHTEKIARRIAATLGETGAVVDLRRAERGLDPRPADYDAVVAGASIHMGRHQREIVEWARRHATTLNGMPTAFFSVCLAVADGTEESQDAARGYIDTFVEETGWSPGRTTTFAGALQYREYDFFTRLMIRSMMKRGGHPTDTSRDHDFTDWEAVERFACECAAVVAEPAGMPT